MLIAADWVIGDHGSATLYGAATGVPVMLAGFPAAEVDPESAPAELAALAPRITRRRPLRAQLARVAAEFQPDHHRRLAELVTSVPGRFDRNMRRLMYRLLDLRQPAVVPSATPIPVPFLVKSDLPRHVETEADRARKADRRASVPARPSAVPDPRASRVSIGQAQGSRAGDPGHPSRGPTP